MMRPSVWWPKMRRKLRDVAWRAMLRLRGVFWKGWPYSARIAVRGGIVPSKRVADWPRLASSWAESEREWDRGFYARAVAMRCDLLHEAYRIQGNCPAEAFPPLMAADWSSNIGHLGLLAMHARAQSLGVIPDFRRTLLVGRSIGNQEILGASSAAFDIRMLSNSSALSDWPSLWPLVERLQMVRYEDSFLDIYQLWEKVYYLSQPPPRTAPGTASDDEGYATKSAEALRILGLPLDAWFVALHLRFGNDSLDPRAAPLASFLPAIDQIVRMGGWVVRFGTGPMEALPETTHLIDLTQSSADTSGLHLYLLSRARFVLTTNSGPAVVAWELGTPVLQTNTMSIGRNVCSASSGSLFLPKKWIGPRGEPMGLAELLNSRFAYCELESLRDLGTDHRVLTNTAEEILEATREMLEPAVEVEGTIGALASQADLIRLDAGAIGQGRFSNSYLAMNEEWFLR
jgi:putative glycosyltransferase (TIGR04372 family)